MFAVYEDLSIYVTRGDIVTLAATADDNGNAYLFQPGDIIRMKVTEKKACENVVLQKDFPVTEETDCVTILLTEKDTKIGGVISKPVDYWYEIELNPLTNPQTIIGYDDEGAKIFKLMPEGKNLEPTDEGPTEEDIPFVDEEFDSTSERPVQNQAITRALLRLEQLIADLESRLTLSISKEEMERTNDVTRLETALDAERARIDSLIN